MAQESEHQNPDSPDFVPSPETDQPGIPPEASAYDAPPASQPDQPDHRPPQVDKFDPVAKEKPKSAPAAKTTPASMISYGLMMVVGAALAAGGYGLARVFAPPQPPGETSGPPPDMVKKDEFKQLTDRVDKMTTELKTAEKQISDRPDYSPELKMQRDRVDALDRSIAGFPAQMDSVRQKLETVSKIEDTNSSTKINQMDQRLTDLASAIDNLRKSPLSSGNAVQNVGEMKVDRLAIAQAIDLYKTKKWSEAQDAFSKLQSIYPNDATVWYYSALANGFATGQWLGETERMVKVGLAKEKQGEPSSATIDSVFSDLTPATGKNWLADYRKRIGVQ